MFLDLFEGLQRLRRLLFLVMRGMLRELIARKRLVRGEMTLFGRPVLAYSRMYSHVEGLFFMF
jgi:hypothetical protein